MITNLAQSIPLKSRKIIYSVIATLVGLEAIFDVVGPSWESKVMSALVVLGFGVAIPNTQVTQYDGNVHVETDDVGNKVFSLELDGDPNDIEFMDEISFRVQK